MARALCFPAFYRNLDRVFDVEVRFPLVLVYLLFYRLLGLYDVLLGDFLGRF
jgi:hypothetical protein